MRKKERKASFFCGGSKVGLNSGRIAARSKKELALKIQKVFKLEEAFG